ncbi:hypothetical protein [Natrinema sp. DC36]|uniref:hypothetical protein n=1 Tax=Natrinema sp. DC36 TaxID=2878680 RepID=UPI001CEFB853|nr:hypothetical protein [Natrinema sp. DC36]
MSLRRDERAVTVQIGAVLMLAIVFAALVLYQVNVVPAENGAIESEHNQNVHDEMQELRNAIRNAGTTGNSQSVSVTLGTQYPTRTFSMNPPDPSGTIETIRPESNVTIVSGNETDEYETRFLVYEPNYNEYRNAPRTILEHSLLYNQFERANVSVGSQQLIGSERITLTLLDGSLQERSSGTVSVPVESLDPVRTTTLEAGSRITVPTESPERWKVELESTEGARYDEAGSGNGTASIVLEEKFELDIARVGVGNGGSSDKNFAIGTERTGNDYRTGGSYDVSFDEPSENVEQCDDAESCDYFFVAGTTATFSATATAQAAAFDFAYTTSDGVTVDTFSESSEDGIVDVIADGNGTIDLFVSSGGVSDTIVIDVRPPDEGPGSETDGISWAITDDTTNNVAQYAVSYNVSAESFDHVQIEFDNIDGGTTTVENRSDPRGTVEYSEGGSGGDSYTITITAFDTNGNVIDTRNETDTADGANPDADDDLSSSTSPRLNGSRVDDWSQPNDNSARYFVSYDVGNRDEFDRVEVSFKNRDSGAITTETATDPRGRLEFSGNSIDDEFGIELRVYDTDGVLVDSRSFGDTADGTNPTANDDLGASTSPQFQSVSVTDNGNNGQSRYTADYTVDSSSTLGTVWAEFRNLDNAWATEIAEQPDADGQFVHEPGGGTGGDAYEITLLVFDSDGAVVDRWYDDNPG